MTRPECSEWCPFSACSTCGYQGGTDPDECANQPVLWENIPVNTVSPHLQQQAGDAAELDWSPTP